MVTAQRLIAYIEEHGNSARLLPSGALEVVSQWCRDGETGVEVEEIPATLVAVRNWLGY